MNSKVEGRIATNSEQPSVGDGGVPKQASHDFRVNHQEPPSRRSMGSEHNCLYNSMASSSSSSPLSPTPPRFPSSSANTIPVAGRSILKRPPQQPQSLFSRISKFLPTTPQPGPEDDPRPLKRAHFILPEIAIVYPISSINPPTTPTLKDERKAIEERELERRRRVLRTQSIDASGEETEEWWPMDKVESFYRECCVGCDEKPDPAISSALKVRVPPWCPHYDNKRKYSVLQLPTPGR